MFVLFCQRGLVHEERVALGTHEARFSGVVYSPSEKTIYKH